MAQGVQRGPTPPAAAAAAGGGAGLGGAGHGIVVPSVDDFLHNPAIAQREVLRHFYLSTDASEQLELVRAARTVLDLHTALHVLSHTADLALKGALPGSADEQEELLTLIHEVLEESVPAMHPPQLGHLLWGLASVGLHPSWLPQLLHTVAQRELAAARVHVYNTRELTSIIYSFGRLARCDEVLHSKSGRRGCPAPTPLPRPLLHAAAAPPPRSKSMWKSW